MNLRNRHEKTVHIANSNVMGRSAVLVLATVLAGVAVLQLADSYSSALLPRFGGQPLNWAWSGALIIGAGLCWAAARAQGAVSDVLELGGIALIVLALGVYAIALYDAFGLVGSGLIYGLSASTIINLTGRAVLLLRRGRELQKASR